MGLMGRARVHDSLNKRSESRQFALQAIDALKPLMAAPDPSVSLRRAYGLAMIYFGFSQMRSDQEEMAVKSLEEARQAYRSIDGLQVGDLPSAAAYAEASAWQVQALQAPGAWARMQQASPGGCWKSVPATWAPSAPAP